MGSTANQPACRCRDSVFSRVFGVSVTATEHRTGKELPDLTSSRGGGNLCHPPDRLPTRCVCRRGGLPATVEPPVARRRDTGGWAACCVRHEGERVASSRGARASSDARGGPAEAAAIALCAVALWWSKRRETATAPSDLETRCDCGRWRREGQRHRQREIRRGERVLLDIHKGQLLAAGEPGCAPGAPSRVFSYIQAAAWPPTERERRQRQLPACV